MSKTQFKNNFGDEITIAKYRELFKDYEKNLDNYLFDIFIQYDFINGEYREKIEYDWGNSKISSNQAIENHFNSFLKEIGLSFLKIEVIKLESKLAIIVFGCKPFVKMNQILGAISSYCKFFEHKEN